MSVAAPGGFDVERVAARKPNLHHASSSSSALASSSTGVSKPSVNQPAAGNQPRATMLM